MKKRGQRWGIFAFVFSFVVFAWTYENSPLAQLAGSDGFYTYMYARSLVYDHDFNFTNDYKICGDPHGKNVDRGAGRPENPFYVGPTIFWAPAMWIAKHVLTLPKDAPVSDVNACKGPIAKWTLEMGSLIGALTIFVSYRIARRVAADLPAALAALLIGMGTPLTGYAFMWPHYAHVYDAFGSALLLFVSLRAIEKPESAWRWIVVGICTGVAYLQRPVSVAFAIVPIALACIVLWKKWRPLITALAIFGLTAILFGALPQALLYKYLYGKYWLAGSPHGRYYINIGHTHAWLTLFGAHGGLFYWSPIAWLAVFGLWPGLRDRKTRALVASGVVASWLLIFVSAAALDWDSSATFGARRLTSLVGFLTLLVALFLVRLEAWVRAKKPRALMLLGFGLLVPVMLVEIGAAVGAHEGLMTIERTVTQEELYAEGPRTIWRFADHTIGDIALLPATLFFHWRYGLPLSSYNDTLDPWYIRDYHSMRMINNVPPFVDKTWAKHLTRFAPTGEGIKMTAPRATFVFTVQWPFAQEMTVRARSTKPAHVVFKSGHFFGDREEGAIDLPGNGTIVTQVIPLPRGAFDSGINEQIVTSTDGPDAAVELLGVSFTDKKDYPNAVSF